MNVELLFFIGLIVTLGGSFFLINRYFEGVHEKIDQTFNDRMAIITAIFQELRLDPEYDVAGALREYDMVTFDDHLKALRKGRNPRDLYSPVIQDIWGNEPIFPVDGIRLKTYVRPPHVLH